MADNEPPTPNVRRVDTQYRARFMRAVGSLYCTAGSHASDHAFVYGGSVWCREHPAPGGPQDPLEPGLCEWSKPHHAKATRVLPGITKPTVRGPRRLCREHLAVLLADYWRRGEYGRG